MITVRFSRLNEADPFEMVADLRSHPAVDAVADFKRDSDTQRRMQLLYGFMAWKSATGFVMSSELVQLDCLISAAVGRDEVPCCGATDRTEAAECRTDRVVAERICRRGSRRPAAAQTRGAQCRH